MQSGEWMIILFLPCIASQLATRLIGPGSKHSEMAQRGELGSLLRSGIQRQRGLTSARQ